MRRFFSTLTLLVATLLGSALAFSDQIQPLLDVAEERAKSEQVSQIKIDSMDDDTSLIVNEYKTVSKQIEGLRYVFLKKQITANLVCWLMKHHMMKRSFGKTSQIHLNLI